MRGEPEHIGDALEHGAQIGEEDRRHVAVLDAELLDDVARLARNAVLQIAEVAPHLLGPIRIREPRVAASGGGLI